MGVYFEEAPGAVAYQFNGNSPMALAHERQNSSIPADIGDMMSFDSLTFPYDFSISAYIDTGLYIAGLTGVFNVYPKE